MAHSGATISGIGNEFNELASSPTIPSAFLLFRRPSHDFPPPLRCLPLNASSLESSCIKPKHLSSLMTYPRRIDQPTSLDRVWKNRLERSRSDDK